MLLTKLLLSLIATLALTGSLHSQPHYFRHYQVEAGLSNNAVICMVQDEAGFMWFGTRDGLNRFDGHTFKVYRFSDNTSGTNRSNLINDLHIDRSGSLLVATEQAIYRYDPKADAFNLVVFPKYFPIDKIESDGRGNIWFNAGLVLARFNQKKKQIIYYDPQIFFRASSLSMDSNGALWVATPDGYLKKYNEQQDSFTSFNLFEHAQESQNKYISPIHCTPDGKILIGSDKVGFKIFDTKTLRYTDITLCCEEPKSLFIQRFLQVSATEFWIGTETGIFIYNSETGQSRKIEKNSTDQYAISDNVIYSLYKDREGGIWVGTYFGGLNYHPKQHAPFQRYYFKPFENSLSGNIVREMTEDTYGNLWIGTEDAGLNKLDAKTGKITHFKPDNTPESISYICVHTLLADGDELWVGTYEHGLDILNIKTGKVVRHYDASSQTGFKSNFPFCFFKTKEGKIIVGTLNGIYMYNRDKDFFEPLSGFPSNGFYMDVLQDAQGTIWASIPGSGIFYVNPNTGKSGNFTFSLSDSASLASSKVNSIFEDRQKNLWFATENGLCKWNPARQNFTRYGIKDGFPSNFMLAMLEDEKGKLWISTTQGLACFDPAQGKVLVYTTASGLLSDQFNFSSAFNYRNNRMYFGSAKGLISFRPSEFRQDTYVPPVFLTGLQIHNQDVVIAQQHSPLTQSISYTKKITLSYDQSTFSLDFAALGYTAPQNLEYAYQLEGLSTQWTYVKENRKASYTKLAPGTYTFKVKASSSSGIWSNKETTLIIEVLPPWWASGWAYTAYALLTALLLYLLFYSYNKRVKEKNRRQIELLENAKEKEILQIEIAKGNELLASKMEFFTQVAHEIKTPLTLIKTPLAKVIRKTAGMPEIENSLRIIGKNTDRLIELTRQLLDFRQIELKAYNLTLEEVNVSELLRDAHTNFTSEAEQHMLHVTLQLPTAPVFAYADADALNKIIYNLFSNAVKYAETKVEIYLLPNHKEENSYTILFKNDGYLIPEEYREKIFEPFFRLKETESKPGTGIGLELARSLAQIQGGSLQLEQPEGDLNVFSLTLPIHSSSRDTKHEVHHSFS